MHIRLHNALFGLALAVRLAYIALFYGLLMGNLNLGDTAAYQSAVFLERNDFTSFAFMMSLLSWLLQGQVWIVDLLFALFLLGWVSRYARDMGRGEQLLILLLLFSPQLLLYLTVYSKEQFVFLALAAPFYQGRLRMPVWLLGLALISFVKPPFALFYLYLLLMLNSRQNAQLELCILAGLLGFTGLALLVLSGNIQSFYWNTNPHFDAGAMSYNQLGIDPVLVPLQVLQRLLLLDLGALTGSFLVVAFGYYFSLLSMAYLFAARGLAAFVQWANALLVGLVAAFPYALFNAGSFVRYVTPLLLVTFLYCLARQRQSQRQGRQAETGAIAVCS